ncbi:ABC transporter transmembrane domain-containing protein [Ferrovibrio xuzhouensis]|uniref:ABC transporter transmembrane domain-containing protein n=1 Tax=Ferrovibrio xuzhouensis TaxID=1576914 RepID=A0ABV7VAN3_9PROT
MEKNLYRFILKHSLKQQITITLLSLASFIPYYYYLSMPKAIVNQGIQGKDIQFPVDLLGLGLIRLDHTHYLLALCVGFLGLVLVQQAFKYVINFFQGVTSERMLRRLRYDLYAQMLRFPLPTFRRTSQGEIIPMIIAEVEPIGGFIGESFALPIFQGGMLLVIFTFLLVQNPFMALAAVALYPIQFYFVPKMQAKVRALGRERIRNQRRLSDRIGETVSGMVEVHTHDVSSRMQAEFTARLGISYWIRVEIFQRKFMIKFLNNFIQQLGPFFFYAIGGYLAIRGQLDVGTVVAAVSAHKEMAAPWKELLNHYQNREDSKQKYEQVVTQFEQERMLPPEYQLDEPETPVDLGGAISVSGVSLHDDQENAILDNLTITVPWPARVAVVGGVGRDELLQLLARTLEPDRGKILINGQDTGALPETVTGRRLAYVGSTSHIFNATLGDNLFLGLRHRPQKSPERTPDQQSRFEKEIGEAIASGNCPFDPEADWTDYKAAGADAPDSLTVRAIDALRAAAFDEDVFQLGMRGSIDPEVQPDMAQRVLEARRAFRVELTNGALADLVESWDPAKYNTNATVAENLMFGTARNSIYQDDNLARDPHILSVLDMVGLRRRFLEIGHEVASTMVELFADLPPDHEFFQQFSFIASDDLPDYKDLLLRSRPDALDQLPEADRVRLMSLPFKLVLARHRLGHFDASEREAILRAREIFARTLPDDRRNAIAFFDPEQFTVSSSIVDNILFGRVAYGQAQAQEKIGRVMADVVAQMELREPIIAVGFQFEVGIAGARLTAAQRQKLAIARSVVKQPDWLLLSEATAALDPRSQAAVMAEVLERRKDRGLVWSLQRAADCSGFDQILVIEGGKLVQSGSYSDLSGRQGRFRQLLEHA